MEEQIEYDKYFEESLVSILDSYCNADFIDFYEKAILKLETKTKRLLDVGCGSGNRLFDYYNKAGIEYFGIEKSKNFISGSKHKNKIFELDLANQEYISLFSALGQNFRLCL